MTKAEKTGFWAAVQDCLVEIYGLKRQVAREKCRELREKIESPPQDYSSDVFYHNEPFDIAGELAGHALDFSKFRAQYEKILASHKW